MPIYFSQENNKFYNSDLTTNQSFTGNNFIELSDNDYLNMLSSNKKITLGPSGDAFYLLNSYSFKSKEEKSNKFKYTIQNLSKTIINYAGYRGIEELNLYYTEGSTTQQNLEIKNLKDWRDALIQKSEEVANNYKNGVLNNLPTLSSFLYDNDLYLSNYTNTFTRNSVIFLPATPEEELPKGATGCSGATGTREEFVNLRTNPANLTPELSINRNTVTQTTIAPETNLPEGYEAGASIYMNMVMSALEKIDPQTTAFISTKNARFNSFIDPVDGGNLNNQGFIYSPAIDVYPSSLLQGDSFGNPTSEQQVQDWINGDQKAILVPHNDFKSADGPYFEGADGRAFNRIPVKRPWPWIITPPDFSRGISGASGGSTPVKPISTINVDCLGEPEAMTGDRYDFFKEKLESVFLGSGCSFGAAESLCKEAGGCFTYPQGYEGDDTYWPGVTSNDNFFGLTGENALNFCTCLLCEVADAFRPKRSPIDFDPWDGSSIDSWNDAEVPDGITDAEGYRKMVDKFFNCCPKQDAEEIAEDAGLSNDELWYPDNYCGAWSVNGCCNSNMNVKVETSFNVRIPLPGIGWVCDEFTWDVDVWDYIDELYKKALNNERGPQKWCTQVTAPGFEEEDLPPSPCSEEDDCIKHPYTSIEKGYFDPEIPEEIINKKKLVTTVKIRIKLRLIRWIWDFIKSCLVEQAGADIPFGDVLFDESTDDCNIKMLQTVLRDDLVFGDNIYIELIIKTTYDGECEYNSTTLYTGFCGCEPYCPCDHPGCSAATGPDGGPCVDTRVPEYLPPPALTAQPLDRDERDELL